ncbi:tripartite tricarboxylate transporter substrate-binding protein [Cupriavidus lacunae]|nr:tripartite tricarboxylate transporter substrate-binding protein [Cupriavidus lacunae]
MMRAIPRTACGHALAAAAVLLSAGTMVVPGTARAQSGVQPAKIIVGFSAGGPFDVLARVLADKLKDELKRPVLVENRPGAGGRVAVASLKGSPADGSVVMLGPDALTVFYPLMARKLSYDPQKDLTPISTVAEYYFAFFTASQSPFKRLGEYKDWAAKQPGGAAIGYSAIGSPHHLFGLMLAKTWGIPFVDVPFPGAPPLMTNLIGGQVSAGIDGLLGSMIEYHRSGKIRILAVSSAERATQVPEVPTFHELGCAKCTGAGFNGMYAPANTPRRVVIAWNDALHKVLAMREVRERLRAMGYEPRPGTPEELAKRTADGLAQWAPAVKATGITID